VPIPPIHELAVTEIPFLSSQCLTVCFLIQHFVVPLASIFKALAPQGISEAIKIQENQEWGSTVRGQFHNSFSRSVGPML
jgi:hypothetical protein